MAADEVAAHGQRRCTVDVSPGEVDADAELTLTVWVACPFGDDLTGQSVSIRDEDDNEVATAELAEPEDDEEDEDRHDEADEADDDDEDAHEEYDYAADIVVKAPGKPGEHTYRAVLPAVEKNGVSHEETAAKFSFTVNAHAARLNVWGMASAIVAGERFKLKVGLKCSQGCKLAGKALTVVDHEGAEVATATLVDEPWPGTTALYYAEVEVEAPGAVGDYKWELKSGAWEAQSDSEFPHAAGAFPFGVKVVGAPDYEVTVEAFDAQKHTPIKGVHVLLHPYRALTDENGVAKVKVTKGTYKLHVSGFTYVAYQNTIDVAGDVTTRAELTAAVDDEEDHYG